MHINTGFSPPTLSACVPATPNSRPSYSLSASLARSSTTTVKRRSPPQDTRARSSPWTGSSPTKVCIPLSVPPFATSISSSSCRSRLSHAWRAPRPRAQPAHAAAHNTSFKPLPTTPPDDPDIDEPLATSAAAKPLGGAQVLGAAPSSVFCTCPAKKKHTAGCSCLSPMLSLSLPTSFPLFNNSLLRRERVPPRNHPRRRTPLRRRVRLRRPLKSDVRHLKSTLSPVHVPFCPPL